MTTDERREEIADAIEKKERWTFFKKSVIERRLGDKDNGINAPYLVRWTILGCPWFSIKIHRILASDEDCLHDHPWHFLSIILWGGYFEETPAWERWTETAVLSSLDAKDRMVVAEISKNKKWYRPGSVLWRPAPRSIHRLELPPECSATSLVITFKKTRQWGFFTKKGWVPWFKYSPQQRCT